MTKQEYKKMMSEGRTVLAMLHVPSWSNKSAAYDIGWQTAFMSIHKSLSPMFWKCRHSNFINTPWSLTKSSHLYCNHSFLPNSYPHPTKNP